MRAFSFILSFLFLFAHSCRSIPPICLLSPCFSVLYLPLFSMGCVLFIILARSTRAMPSTLIAISFLISHAPPYLRLPLFPCHFFSLCLMRVCVPITVILFQRTRRVVFGTSEQIRSIRPLQASTLPYVFLVVVRLSVTFSNYNLIGIGTN